MNKKTVYLILASTLSGMGLQAGITAAGINTVPAANAAQKVFTEMAIDADGQACVESMLDRLACPNVNAKLELAGADLCDASTDFWVVSVSAVAGKDGARAIYARSNIEKAGSWTPGQPK